MKRRVVVTAGLAVVIGVAAVAFRQADSGDTTARPERPSGASRVDLRSLPATTSVSRFGITWTFDAAYPSGTFANGDPWVVGPVRITGITPGWNGTQNGSVLDPVVGSAQGYDSNIFFDNYKAELNVGRRVSPAAPLPVDAGSSLVSTISKEATNEDRPYLATAAVLTVLADPAPAGSFRPAFAGGTSKVPRFNVADLHRDRLGHVPMVGEPPDLASVERWFERPWLDVAGSGWEAQYQNPTMNMKSYGREISDESQTAALLLQTDLSDADKETLLIRVVQTGIDLYGISKTPGGARRWGGADGHNGGRKVLIVIAGLVLADKAMASPDALFAEDEQTYYGRGWFGADDRAKTPLWRGVRGLEYEHKHPRDWTVDGRGKKGDPDAGEASNYRSEEYRHCCTALTWPGTALAIRLMGPDAIRAWDHPAFFDYVDRWMTQDWAPYAAVVKAETAAGAPDNSGGPGGWIEAMWLAHREL